MPRTRFLTLATALATASLAAWPALSSASGDAAVATAAASTVGYSRAPSPMAGTRVAPLDAMRERAPEHYDPPTVPKDTAAKEEKKAPEKKPEPVVLTQPAVTPSQVYVPGIPRKSAHTPLYPLKRSITTTVFWIGEQPSGRNRTPNHKSSWDSSWMQNYGGYDDPDPAKRINYRPKGFIPKLNSFYVALPYNDVQGYRRHRAEAERVIPWFRKSFVSAGKSVCKGRWVAIRYGSKVCFAQWEDCGPFETDDWSYVFGNSRPKTPHNRGAGIDISPAVRDFLGLRSGAKVDWRFVDPDDVAPGPWRLYGRANAPVKVVSNDEHVIRAERERLGRLREDWQSLQSAAR